MLLQQGEYPADTSPCSSRMMYFSIATFAFVMHVSYSALLTAAMVSVPKELQVRSFEDLALSDLNVYVIDGGATADFFRRAPRGTGTNHVYENKLRDRAAAMLKASGEGTERLRQDPRGVFYTYRASFKDPRNEFYALKSFRGQPVLSAIGLRKGSCLLPAIDAELRAMEQSGILHKLRVQHGIISLRKPKVETSTESLGLDTVLFPFLSLCVGLACGVALVAAEVGGEKALCMLSRSGSRRRRRGCSLGARREEEEEEAMGAGGGKQGSPPQISGRKRSRSVNESVCAKFVCGPAT